MVGAFSYLIEEIGGSNFLRAINIITFRKRKYLKLKMKIVVYLFSYLKKDK